MTSAAASSGRLGLAVRRWPGVDGLQFAAKTLAVFDTCAFTSGGIKLASRGPQRAAFKMLQDCNDSRNFGGQKHEMFASWLRSKAWFRHLDVISVVVAVAADVCASSRHNSPSASLRAPQL